MDSRLESALRYADDIDLFEHLSRRILPSITVAAGTHKFSMTGDLYKRKYSPDVEVALVRKTSGKRINVIRGYNCVTLHDVEELKTLAKLLSTVITTIEKGSL